MKRISNIIIALIMLLLTGCILVNPLTLDFGSDESTKTLTLTVIGDVEWSITHSENWIKVEPDSGQGTASITVTVDRTGLEDDYYEARLNISANPNLPCSDVIVKMEVGGNQTTTSTTSTTTTSEIIFSYYDDHDSPSGITGEVDNSLHKMKVTGIANPSSSRYVYFSPAPIPLANIRTTVFEADISLPTGLRTGILDGPDPCGDQSDNSIGTPVLFRVEFTPFTFAEISMSGAFGLRLEQVINNVQPDDEISVNGRPARVNTPISYWTGGPVSFDPLKLIPEASVGVKFHARLSIDFEQNMVKAEIIPDPSFLERFNPFPAGSVGAMAAPFVAVTDLIDYTQDPNFDENLEYKILIRTNGNSDVDDPSAPGGTLRYINREFTNVDIDFNQPIDFPIVPQIIFPPDDFNDSIIAPNWELYTPSGLNFVEEDNLLKLTGNSEFTDVAFFISTDAQRQDIAVEIDFRAPTGFQNATYCVFRVQFDFFNYFEIAIDNDGYKLSRWIESEGGTVGNSHPLFGDETINFHRLKLSYTDDTGHIDAFVDDIQLNGIEDKFFASSFTHFQFSFFSNSIKGQYIEREWDNFASQ